MPNQPLNIVYLHSHDTGRYVGPYGHAAPTPNLQRFAERGVLFRRAFCANPTCSPSRAALLTGMYAHSCGMLGLAHRGFEMPDYSRHLAQFLKSHGYATALSGVQHEIAHDRKPELGYEQILDSPGNDFQVGAAAFIRSDHGGRPFFLSCGFGETHRGFPDPAADEPATDPRYVTPPAPLPDTPETRHDTAAYHTLVRKLDEKMGAVIDAVDEAGLADRTLIIVTTDHGIPFPRMKCNLTDHGIGVMLMVRGPETTGFVGGQAIDSMVSHIDLFPTLCELIGVDPPDHLQGRSILPLVRGERETIRDAVFAEVNYHAAYEPKRCVRTDRWKLIRYYGEYERTVMPNIDPSASKELLSRHNLAERVTPRERLFDLIYDPHETHNLADDPAYAGTLEEMRNRLDRWMRETGDPLLEHGGAVPAPRGAKINRVEGQSPKEEPIVIE